MNITTEPHRWYTGTTSFGGDNEVPLLGKPFNLIVAKFLLYGMLLLLGLVANAVVVKTALWRATAPTNSDLLIANQALVDLVALILDLPLLVIHMIFINWTFGWFPCKLIFYLYNLLMGASMITLCTLAFERYTEIYDFLKIRFSSPTTILVIFLIWILSVFVHIPYYNIYNSFHQDGLTVCAIQSTINNSILSYKTVMSFLHFYLPLIFLVLLYSILTIKIWNGSQPNKDVDKVLACSTVQGVKMLIVAATVQAVCQLPMMILRMLQLYRVISYNDEYFVSFIFFWTNFKHCTSPLLYCYFSQAVRDEFRKLATSVRSTICCSRSDPVPV